jgi:hypothetical protein
MMRMNSCPNDRQQIEFYGISRHNVPGRRNPVRVRWSFCSTCTFFHADNFKGKIVHSRKTEPNKKWFIQPKEGR